MIIRNSDMKSLPYHIFSLFSEHDCKYKLDFISSVDYMQIVSFGILWFMETPFDNEILASHNIFFEANENNLQLLSASLNS